MTIWRGPWNGTTSYAAGDGVFDQGIGWIAASAPATGARPGNDAVWIETSPSLVWRGFYVAGTAYAINDAAFSGGTAWAAIQATTGNAPSDSSAYWRSALLPGIWRGTYNAGSAYVAGDTVAYAGGVFKLIVSSSTGSTPTAMPAAWLSLQAATGTTIAFTGTWSGTVAYTLGNVVLYAGSLWQAMAGSTGVAPGAGVAQWTAFAGPAVMGLPTGSSSSSTAGQGSVVVTAAAMLGELLDYIQRFQTDTEPSLVSSDWLAENNQHSVSGRAGYLPDRSSTSESQVLMIRGLARAYLATGQAPFLARAKSMASRLFAAFFFGVTPSGTAASQHHWLVHNGAAIQSQGPIDADNPAFGGNIAQAVTFSAGTANLGANLARVFKVYDDTGILVWNNVFSGLLAGTAHDVAYFVDQAGTKWTGLNSDGAWGLDAQPASGLTPGTVVLADTTIGGTLRVNSTDYVSTMIAHGEPHEAWPFIRPLAAGERQMATDAIHWAIDAFDLLAQAEPMNAEWLAAKTQMLATWSAATAIDTSTMIFRQDASGVPYNSVPLSYLYWYFDGDTFPSGAPPQSYIGYTRDSDGYVVLGIPSDSGRGAVVFENSPLFLGYDVIANAIAGTAPPAFSLALNLSVAAILRLTYTLNGTLYESRQLLPAGASTLSVPIAGFRHFPASNVWLPGMSSYAGTATQSQAMISAASTGTILTQTIGLTGASDYWGFAQDQIFGDFTTDSPPILAYAGGSGVQMRLTDHAGWLWVKPLPAQASVAELVSTWSDFTASGYQTNTGTVPSAPDSSGPIQKFELIAGAAASIDVAYWSIAAATSAVAGSIGDFAIRYEGTAALTLKIGDVSLTGGGRTGLPYVPGALPFNYGIGNIATYSAGGKASGAPFQGPPYAGYQNPRPWIDLGQATALANAITFLADAQAAYHASTGTAGPFAPVYIWATWDAEPYGSIGTWSWNGPDPNTGWGGFQYRAFVNIAETWKRCRDANSASTNAAGTVAQAFLSWLDGWLTGNPAAKSVPDSFAAGVPPSVASPDPHMAANALKGVIFCALAGADRTVTSRVAGRLIDMLATAQVGYGDMRGSFSPDPDGHVFYGFWAGELLDALALVIINAQAIG